MADNKKGQHPHIVLQNKAKAEVFSVPQRKVDPKPVVGRDRARHGSKFNNSSAESRLGLFCTQAYQHSESDFETDEDRSYFLVRLPVHEKVAELEQAIPEVTVEVRGELVALLNVIKGRMTRHAAAYKSTV